MSAWGLDRREWFAWDGNRIIGVQSHEEGDTLAKVGRSFKTATRIELIVGQQAVSELMRTYVRQLDVAPAPQAEVCSQDARRKG